MVGVKESLWAQGLLVGFSPLKKWIIQKMLLSVFLASRNKGQTAYLHEAVRFWIY